jgi:hypothetical protein
MNSASAQQPIQATKRAELETEQTANNARKSDVVIAKYAMADILIIDQAIASALDYIVKNPTADAKTIEKGLVQYAAVIENVKSTLLARTFLGYLAIELPAFAAAGALNEVKLSSADQKSFKSIGGQAQQFLDGARKKNVAPLKDYLNTAVKYIRQLVEATPAVKNTVEASLLSLPAFADIKNAYLSNAQIGGDETDNTIAIASSAFVTSLLVGVFIALFFWGGSLAANSVVWRHAAYRILYFIWGGVFFVFTIPYYMIYVNLIKDHPLATFAGAIPLRVPAPVEEEEVAAVAAEEAEEATLWSALLFPVRLFKGLFSWMGPVLFEYKKDGEYDDYVSAEQAAWNAETAAVSGATAAAPAPAPAAAPASI